MNHDSEIERLLRQRPRSTAEIGTYLGLSGATVTRAVARIPGVIQMGRARAVRYGVIDRLIDVPPQSHGVFRVTRTGEVSEIGRITPIMGAEFWYENLEAPSRSRLYDSLPWFLQDMRPQGYLGRATVRDFAANGWPRSLDRWTERHVLASLVQSSAHDHIGNLLIGDRSVEAFTRTQRNPLAIALPAEREARLRRYELAVARIDTDPPSGSSINGEQPKFTANVETADGLATRSVIVKFTAPISTEAGRRWADLLVMEERALELISADLGVPSARAECFLYGERAYLEVDRFDRTPEGGRRGVISLTSLDAEYVGLGEGWRAVSARLVEAGQLEPAAVDTLSGLELLGDLLGNTDRHLGNVSVLFDGERPMPLAPVYDFLPMRYAPTPLGMHSDPLVFDHAAMSRQAVSKDVRAVAIEAAARYWRGCADDSRISEPMRSISAANAATVERLSSMGETATGYRTSFGS